MEVAAAMDFHALSRRELQALCKRNGVRANMTNAAMADALQGLTSVDGIDEIGTTLCLPTPGRSAMKSAAVAGDEQQQGSPLPRGRRVSVMSPAAIRMDVMEGDDELKQDLVKEIVKTPGVALRSTSRRARATAAPLPTPGTLRRSTRTATRKAAAPVEAENLVEEESTVKRTTRKASARSKMMVDLDLDGEVAAASPKVQQEEPKAVASDVKCDDPEEEEEEVTKIQEGDNKEKEPEDAEEADSSDAASGSALVSSFDDLKVEEAAAAVEQEPSKPQEGTVEGHEPISEENSVPLEHIDDSPILGVLSKAEVTESERTQDDEGVAEWSLVNEMTDEINPAVEDDEGVAEWSPVNEMTDEINPAVEDKAVAVAVVEEILPSAEISEEKEGEAEPTEDGTSEDEEWSSDDDETSEEIDSPGESDEEYDETSEEGDFNNVKEKLVQRMQDTAITQEASEDDSAEEEVSGDDSAEEEVSGDDSAEEEARGDISAEEEASGDDSAEEEASEDDSAEEKDSEDGFSSDLPPEFDNTVVSSDAETESDSTPPVLEENQVAAAYATKTAVKSRDESAISLTNKEEGSEEEDVSDEAIKEVAHSVDAIVKSLDEFTIKEGTHQTEENIGSEALGLKEMQVENYNNMSLRKLKSTYKERLAAKDGKKRAEAKRLPLEAVEDNACSDC